MEMIRFLQEDSMSIPESQFEIWAKQGPIDSSSKTYQSIKNALESHTSPISSYISSGIIKIYLQGSYANTTNIRGDSDVDVVVELTQTFHSNKTELSPVEKILHDQTYGEATYSWKKLKEEVVMALESYFGGDYVDTSGNKSIKVLPNSGRLRADVVPVVSYKKYEYFRGHNDHKKQLGVTLYHATTGEAIINYPDLHYQNGVKKHADTHEWFKPTVRIVKNMVSYLVDQGDLEEGDAPSYFVQCMVYNVPNNLFGVSYVETIENVLIFLAEADLNRFECQHYMSKLFGNDDTHWNIVDAQKTIVALLNLIKNWYA